MPFERGRVVKSLKGRDKGSFLACVSAENGCVFVCDGKERPLARPKKKNIKHIEECDRILNEEQLKTNKQLRRSLRDLNCKQKGDR